MVHTAELLNRTQTGRDLALEDAHVTAFLGWLVLARDISLNYCSLPKPQHRLQAKIK